MNVLSKVDIFLGSKGGVAVVSYSPLTFWVSGSQVDKKKKKNSGFSGFPPSEKQQIFLYYYPTIQFYNIQIYKSNWKKVNVTHNIKL